MLLRLLRRSFGNQRKAMAVMVVSVAFGTALAASLLTVSFEISDKVARELRAFGANITVEPRREGLAELSGAGRYLKERDLPKIKTIFWRHNIVGFAPFLEARVDLSMDRETVDGIPATGTWYQKDIPQPGEQKPFRAGVVSVAPWWELDGAWPVPGRSPVEIALGRDLAGERNLVVGDAVVVNGRAARVTAVVTTGGPEDERVLMDIDDLQSLTARDGKISRVLVSALTTPMDAFAYKDPETMSRAEYEKWYCTGYVTSIAQQIQEVMTGSRARPVWKIAETEGVVLNRLKAAVYLLSAISLLASALGVGTTMITSLLRRTDEIGLMKAIGADSVRIVILFLSEAVVIGLAGGTLGLIASAYISKWIGIVVFQTVLAQRDALIPLALGISLIIAVLGSLFPIVRALRIQPAMVLKGAE